jgi:hypothetical protein
MTTFINGITAYGGEESGLGPSSLWKGCAFQTLERDENRGYAMSDNFLTLPTGKYTATQATTGTFALSDAEGGVALADSGSTTVVQGINVQLNSTVGAPFFTQATGIMWFEARLKAADITDSGLQKGPEFFCGLSEIDTTVIGTSANTSANHIGFESVSDDNVLLFHAEVAGVRTSSTASIHTLVDDTYVRLGFKVVNRARIEVYVNGVKVDTLTAGFPLVGLTPTFVCQSGGTTDPILHLDWWKCAVERNGN